LVEPNNATQVRGAIQLSSSLWGGSLFPIIPLHRGMPVTWRENARKAPAARDVVLGLIDAFDPDILVQFAEGIPSYLSATGLKIVKPTDIWQHSGEGHNTPAYGIGIFEVLGNIYREFFKYKAKYPVKVLLPSIPRQMAVFWASVFGEVPEHLMPALRSGYFEPLEIEQVQIETSRLKDLLTENVLFPRRISEYGVSLEGRPGLRGSAAAYFMDAAKLDDIVDYWNLRATGRYVLPLPKQLKDDLSFREVATHFFMMHRVHWANQPQHCDFASIIRSRNSTMEELEGFARGFRIERPKDDPSNDGFFSLQHWYPRVWDEWARDKDGGVAETYGQEHETIDLTDANEGGFRFRSLFPAFADKDAYTGNTRCMNEVSFRFFGADEHFAEVFPKASGNELRRALGGFGSISEWRAGRNGLSKFVRYELSETRELLTSESVFFAWLADRGWSAKLSVPGILAKQIFQRLDGHVGILRNENLLKLLEHMSGGRVAADESRIQNRGWQERDMSISEVENRLRGTGHRDLHEYLATKGIFKIGLRTKCPRCQRHSWFSLESLAEHLNCPKCLNSFPAIGNVSRGEWRYKTSGPFSVPGYADGGYATLLTLDFFSDYRLHTMRTSAVPSFAARSENGGDLEADFGLFWRESLHGSHLDGLALGECKTYGVFKAQDFTRMKHLARMFPGAVLVFSTLRKSLTRNEVAGITRLAKAGRKYWKPERPINPVLILTGTELLAYEGPPHCWEDTGKGGHYRGFLNLCDATQQRYLGLPSWQKEWRDKWE
jgi:hypothetical protein